MTGKDSIAKQKKTKLIMTLTLIIHECIALGLVLRLPFLLDDECKDAEQNEGSEYNRNYSNNLD